MPPDREPASGRAGSTQKRGFTTKRDAERFANKVEVSKMAGEYVAPSLGKTTIAALGPPWLERQRGHMKPSGFRTVESAWRVHVAPRWATKRIADIRYTDVQAWVSELSAKLSASTTTTAFSVLARILDDAVRDRILASNASRGVKLPKRPPPRHVYLTASQVEQLAAEFGRYRSLVPLLGVGGCAGVNRRRYVCVTSIFCVAVSTSTAMPFRLVPSSRWAL